MSARPYFTFGPHYRQCPGVALVELIQKTFTGMYRPLTDLHRSHLLKNIFCSLPLAKLDLGDGTAHHGIKIPSGPQAR